MSEADMGAGVKSSHLKMASFVRQDCKEVCDSQAHIVVALEACVWLRY